MSYVVTSYYCSVKKVLIGKASCHARGDDLRTTYQDFFYKTLLFCQISLAGLTRPVGTLEFRTGIIMSSLN